LIIAAGIGILTRRFIASRHPPETRVLSKLMDASELRASLALDVEQVIRRCKRLDQKFLGNSIAILITEYDRASSPADRQTALFRATELFEKLSGKFSPWYVRYKNIIAWGVTIAGSAAGTWKIVAEVLAARPHVP